MPLTAVGTLTAAVGRGGIKVRVTGKAHLRPVAGITLVPFDVRLDSALLRPSWLP